MACPLPLNVVKVPDNLQLDLQIDTRLEQN
jgi:hypothetical protein